jgi:hypothetical protein
MFNVRESRDTKSKTELFKTISTVKNAIADTQEEKRNVAYVHCFAEQIELGKLLLR